MQPKGASRNIVDQAIFSNEGPNLSNPAETKIPNVIPKKYKSLRKQNYKLWKSVQAEDVDIIEGMQEGRNSPSYNGGNFSPVMDNPTHHFHKWVAENII